MLIYRVEHRETGRGPFRQDGNYLANIFQSKLESHPPPMQDGIVNFMEGLDYLGCFSLEQLKFWFQEHIDILKEMNMVVRVFSTNDDFVQVGRTQVAFSRHSNDIVEEFSLDNLI